MPERPTPALRRSLVAGLAGVLWTWAAVQAAPRPPAAEGELVFIAATNHTAPLSTFEGDRLAGGIVKDLGDALAHRMGLRARYVSQPSKRAPQALRDGMGDLLCYTRPQWIGADLRFTVPVLPNAEVVAARAEAPVLRNLRQLEGQAVGSVLGYQYPDLDQALGDGFRRDNAIDMTGNLRKLMAGRMAYALTDRLVLSDLRRRHPELGLREDLVVNSFVAPCALSPKSKLSLTALNAALRAMLADGTVQRIVDRYAPPAAR